METMGNLRRTHYVGALRAQDAGTEMTAAGSIAKCRDKGGVIFADLRDTTGLLQLIFDDSTAKDVFEKASHLKTEYVVIGGRGWTFLRRGTSRRCVDAPAARGVRRGLRGSRRRLRASRR